MTRKPSQPNTVVARIAARIFSGEKSIPAVEVTQLLQLYQHASSTIATDLRPIHAVWINDQEAIVAGEHDIDALRTSIEPDGTTWIEAISSGQIVHRINSAKIQSIQYARVDMKESG